jgi:hypothetical protein
MTTPPLLSTPIRLPEEPGFLDQFPENYGKKGI